MGLINIFKDPGQIDLSLSINQSPLFTNDDIIKGEVTVLVKSKTAIKSLKVILVGRSTTSINFVADLSASKTLEETHTLVYRGKELFPPKEFKGSCSLKQGTFKFPFELTIPGSKFNVACIGSGLHDQIFNANSAAYHSFMLPPTFEYRGAGGHGKIEYFVKAMVEPAVKEMEALTTYRSIMFTPKGSCTSFHKSHLKGFPDSCNDCQVNFQYEDQTTIFEETPPTPTSMTSFSAPTERKKLSIIIPTEKRSSLISRFRSNSTSAPSSPLNQSPLSPTYLTHSRRRNKSFASSIFQLTDYAISLNVVYNHTVSMNFDSKGVVNLRKPLSENLTLNLVASSCPEEIAETLTITGFQIKLVSLVSITAEHVSQQDQVKQELLLKSTQPIIIDTTDFRKVSEFCQTNYVYNVDKELFKYTILDPPSFEVCNLRNDYQLAFFVDATMMGQHRTFRVFSDVIFLNSN